MIQIKYFYYVRFVVSALGMEREQAIAFIALLALLPVAFVKSRVGVSCDGAAWAARAIGDGHVTKQNGGD